MQKAVIKNQQDNATATQTTLPQELRLHHLTDQELRDQISTGVLTHHDLRDEINAYMAREERVVKPQEAVMVYRQLCATHHLRDTNEAEKAFVYRQFAKDCVEDGWKLGQLEWAVGVWRRGDSPFAPTYGQLLAIRNEGGRNTGLMHATRIRDILNPQKEAPASQPKPDNGERAAWKKIADAYSHSKSALREAVSEYRSSYGELPDHPWKKLILAKAGAA